MIIIRGKVVTHNKRGKRLGFPTANINLHKPQSEGVYISQTKIGREIYHSLTFIGAAKTFNEKKLHCETYILDFKQNLYGKYLTVKLLKKIRENKKFKSVDQLIDQMKRDEILARKYFKIPPLD